MEKLREPPITAAVPAVPVPVPPPTNGTNGVHKEDRMFHQLDVAYAKWRACSSHLDYCRFWMQFRKWDKVLFRTEWVCNVTSSFSGNGFKTDPKTAWRHTLLPDTKVDIYLCQKKLLGSYSYWFLVVFSTGRSNKFVPRAAYSTSLPSFPHFHTHPIDNDRGLN